MAVTATPRSFDKKFAFLFEIDGFLSAGFSKMSALEVEVAEVKQYEGGRLIPDKSPGRVDFKDITLERGATRADFDAYLWFTSVVNAQANVGLDDPFFKRHGDLIQLDRSGLIIKRWTIFNAWPKMFTAGDWDNNADENVIEKLVICFDYFVRTL